MGRIYEKRLLKKGAGWKTKEREKERSIVQYHNLSFMII